MEQQTKRLPIGVAIIAILVIIEAVIQLLGAFGIFGVSTLSFFGAAFALSFALTTIGVVFLFIGIVELAVGIGLLSLEKWAWTLTVIVVWIDLVFDIIAAIVGAQSFGATLVSLIIPVVVLAYMYLGGVRESFQN